MAGDGSGGSIDFSASLCLGVIALDDVGCSELGGEPEPVCRALYFFGFFLIFEDLLGPSIPLGRVDGACVECFS